MEINREQIEQIVAQVLEQQMLSQGTREQLQHHYGGEQEGHWGVLETLDDAVSAAQASFRLWQKTSLEDKARCIEAMRKVSLEHADSMAHMAYVETGLGRAEDKVKKNRLQARKTPGLEDVKSHSFTGDHGLSLVEYAPFGVVGSITPTTNPVATIINNSISMLSAGNAVVFNPHPRAKNCCLKMIRLLNQAIAGAGGPRTLVTTVSEPSLKTSQELMSHPQIRCLVVTGGGAVVKAAMSSGKKAIAAGPGNPPVVVDETAHILKAASDTVLGSSFDNNIMCTCEKVVFCVQDVFEEYKRAMVEQNDCYELNHRQMDALTKVILPPPPVGQTKSVLNRDLIGQHASDIAKAIGLDLPRETRLLVAEVDQDHPLVAKEQMMPVLPLVRCRDHQQAIEWALQAEGERYHTAVMHSQSVERLSWMARASNANIFVKNGPNFAGLGFGGEGHTTMTIAGSTGEGITSARTFTRERRCALIDYFRIV